MPCRFGDLRLGMTGNDGLCVTRCAHDRYAAGLSRAGALVELSDIKVVFRRILNSSDALKDFLKDKHIAYHLGCDTSTNAGGICTEKNGKVEWHYTLAD